MTNLNYIVILGTNKFKKVLYKRGGGKMVRKLKQVKFKNSDFKKLSSCGTLSCPEIATKSGMVAIRNNKDKKMIVQFTPQEWAVLMEGCYTRV